MSNRDDETASLRWAVQRDRITDMFERARVADYQSNLDSIVAAAERLRSLDCPDTEVPVALIEHELWALYADLHNLPIEAVRP